MVAWRPAKSIAVLLAEVNEAAPNRSKLSDGILGDPAHAARVSDHNPNSAGVVTAIDITHDPDDGCDARVLSAHFRTLALSGDLRIKYVIFDRRIFNRSISPEWRPYSGSNPHTAHVHLSVSATAGHYDSTNAWGITRAPSLEAMMFCELGDKGMAVTYLQLQLRELGYDVKIDGHYGPATSTAVLAARKRAGANTTSGDVFDARGKIQIERLLTGVRTGDVTKRLDNLSRGHTNQHTRLAKLEAAAGGDVPDGFEPLSLTVLAKEGEPA